MVSISGFESSLLFFSRDMACVAVMVTSRSGILVKGKINEYREILLLAGNVALVVATSDLPLGPLHLVSQPLLFDRP